MVTKSHLVGGCLLCLCARGKPHMYNMRSWIFHILCSLDLLPSGRFSFVKTHPCGKFCKLAKRHASYTLITIRRSRYMDHGSHDFLQFLMRILDTFRDWLFFYVCRWHLIFSAVMWKLNGTRCFGLSFTYFIIGLALFNTPHVFARLQNVVQACLRSLLYLHFERLVLSYQASKDKSTLSCQLNCRGIGPMPSSFRIRSDTRCRVYESVQMWP